MKERLEILMKNEKDELEMDNPYLVYLPEGIRVARGKVMEDIKKREREKSLWNKILNFIF